MLQYVRRPGARSAYFFRVGDLHRLTQLAAATLQWRFKHFNDGLLLLTLLEPQSRYGDNRLKLQVVCPPNGTAVLKGLKAILNMCARSLAPRVRFFVGEESLKCVV